MRLPERMEDNATNSDDQINESNTNVLYNCIYKFSFLQLMKNKFGGNCSLSDFPPQFAGHVRC